MSDQRLEIVNTCVSCQKSEAKSEEGESANADNLLNLEVEFQNLSKVYTDIDD